ncbi:ribonuclease H-like domain-containing protein [Tanacetum coccineum]|uniref:Ribonuclease H-like domain-containing protein n=1 Tax=Tanacetum coccineum TaxID=301880 RepID=A0ABQ5B2T9_9ASTR
MSGSEVINATPSLSDKLSLVTHHHLLTRVPVKLDLEDWNYGSWEYFFFDQLCSGYDVLKFIRGTPTDATPTSTSVPFTPDELKVDKIILSWIFTTISDPLQKRLVVARPNTAKEAWDILTNIVKDNKRTRASTLKTELRSIQLGTLNVVHYAITGLPEKYNQVCRYMHYQTTFPDLKTVRSLLVAEEMCLKTKEVAFPTDSSSPMVLMAQAGTNRRPSNPQIKSWRRCFNFAKGSCRSGSECHYVHDVNAKSHDFGTSKLSNTSNTDALLVQLLEKLNLRNKDVFTHGSTVASTKDNPPISPLRVAYSTQHNSSLAFLAQQSTTGPIGSGSTNTGHATLLPQAFTVGTLHDPNIGAWNMDTGLSDAPLLLRCDSTDDLYPVTAPSPIPHTFLVNQHTWHQRLGHPGSDVLRRLISNNVISCNKEKPHVLCHACQLGKHVRLPFDSSSTIVTSCFDIIHSDVWTSPIPSLSGFKYYVLFLDHYSHFVWVYPLIHKSDVLSKFMLFRNYVRTQFKCEIHSFQCDHGGEFDNRTLHKLFTDNGIQFRFLCPKTSHQNGKSERMVHTINNIIRTLLFQANLPPTFWVEALNIAVHLLNILPSTTIANDIPFTRMFGTQPDYSLLRTFGCLCYPHLYPDHKLEPRATLVIFLGHASNHRGYRCLDLHTNKIIISRHVTFDETVFPYGSTQSASVPSYTFLDEPDINPLSISVSTIQPPVHEPTTPPTSQTHAAHSLSLTTQTPITPYSTQSNDHATPPSPNSAQHVPTIIPDPPSINPNPDSVHHMVTHFRVGTNRPVEHLTLHVSSVSPLPISYRKAFNDVNWQSAMRDEYNALITNSTWTLVPRPPDVNVVRCMWLFHHKYLADGTVSRYKARLVAIGSTQLERIDVDETFSPVVKPGTIRTPPGFWDSTHPDYVCLLLRSLYGLKQAFALGFSDLHLILPGSLHQEFAMTDLGSLNYFLGISVRRDSLGMFLSQKKYAFEILERARMVNYNPNRTPVDTESKLGTTGAVVSDPTLYRSLAGSLQYLTFTRPDISYAVQQVCLHMHDPREPHFSALKRILRYVCGTLDYGLQLFSSSTTDLVAYSDADWAGCPTTRRSTSGYCVFLGNNLLSWSAKRQPTLSRSSAEAEYRGVANVVAETCWLRNLLRELHTLLSSATLVYCDNVSAVYLSSNPVQHQRTKHIEIDIHFVRDLVATGQVRVLHVPSRYQFADIFTKGLPTALFEEFRSSLSVRCPLAQTAGEC